MKTAIVTGSSRGIGFDIAQKLFEKGYHVILNSSSYNKDTEQKFEKYFGKNFSYVGGDIACGDTMDKLILCASKFGRLDILVNNAGIAPPVREDILISKEDSFDKVINTNLKATYFMTQRAANYMIKTLDSHGNEYIPRIINIGSISAYVSSTNRGEYCISKAGVSMITKLFADRLAEYGIPVNEVRPGIIKTDMTSKVTAKYDALIEGGLLPIARWGTPEDIADAVYALCSGALPYVTGQSLDVDGGFHLRRL